MSKTSLPSDPYLDRIEAQDSKLYLEILFHLIEHKVANKSIARHGRTPAEVLSALAKEKDAPIYEIVQHPNCPDELLSSNLQSPDSLVRLSVANNPNLSPSQIELLASDQDDSVKFHLSNRKDLSEGVIRKLFDWANNVANQEYGHKMSWFYGIAKNPNTPRDIIEKLLKFDLKDEDYEGSNLGNALMSNPSLLDEERAFLSINGVAPKAMDSRETNMLEHEGLPSSKAFEIQSFPIQYIQALAKAGHPFALFHPELAVAEFQPSFNEYIDYFIKSEIIYRTLWPELIERGDVKFFYLRSSYDGDAVYFHAPGLRLDHNFTRGSMTYNSMSYAFIQREWVEVIEGLDWDEVIGLFEHRTFDEFVDFEMEEIQLAFSISHSVLDKRVELTEKGREFLTSEGSNWFDDDVEYHVRIHSKKALPYSWKKLSKEKQLLIAKVIIDGFNEKVDGKYQFAEHFLVCIALLPNTSSEVRTLVETVDSVVVRQALAIS